MFFSDSNNLPDYGSAVANQTETNSEQLKNAAVYSAASGQYPGASLGAAIGFTALDLADTVASALPGVDRGDINNRFLNAINVPGLRQWHDENQGAIEVASGVAGVIASAYAGGALLKSGSWAMRAIQGVPFVGRVAALDAQYTNAVRLAQLTTREAATQGLTGVARMSTAELTLARIGQSALTVTPKQAALGVVRAGVARGLATNLATEGIMAATLHNNSFLYSDSFAHNVAWSAAGIGLGAGLDRLVGTYTLRKIANSEALRRINAGVYDATGLEKARLGKFSESLDPETLKNFDGQFAGSGAITDRVSSLAIQAGQNLQPGGGFTQRALNLFQKREAIATPQLTQAYEEMSKATQRGLRSMSDTGFSMDIKNANLKPATQMVQESLFRQPESMYGIEEIGRANGDATLSDLIDIRNSRIDKRAKDVGGLIENGGRWRTRTFMTKEGKRFTDELIPLADGELEALQAEQRELNFARSNVGMVMVEPGEWAPQSMAKFVDGFTPRQIVVESEAGADGLKVYQRERLKGEDSLGISTNGDMFIPAGGKLEGLSTHDMLHLYGAGERMLADFKANPKLKFNLPKNPNWFQLDLAERILQQTDRPEMVAFPKGMNRQTAQVESFAQKVDALRNPQRWVELADDPAKAFEVKTFFNLPRLTSYQTGLLGDASHPLDILLSSFKSGAEVRAQNFDDLLKGVNDAKKIRGMTDGTAARLDDLSGNSFGFLKDRDGNQLEPLLGFKRPTQPFEWSQDSLALRQTAKADAVRRSLTESADPMTREIVTQIMSDPNFIEAGKVAELADDQARSFLPGFLDAAPQTTRGSLINAVTNRERRDVDNLTMLAASKIREITTRITQGLMKEAVQGHMGDLITQVNQKSNQATKLLLNQFHTFRPGWDLARDVVPASLPDGRQGFAFVLDHTSVQNQRRWVQQFGSNLEKGQRLVSPNGTTIVLDELGLQTQQALQGIHVANLQMKNSLLRAHGLGEIVESPWYVPPPNLKGKYVGYTFDMQGKVVPGMAVVADSPEQLAKMSAELQKSDQWRNGYRFRQRDSISSFMDIWDKAQTDFIAPNVTAAQPGKKNFGLSTGNLLNTSAFDEALLSVRDSMIQHGDDILGTIFQEQIKSAKARAQIARTESQVGRQSVESHSSIYDRYLENLLGKNALGAKDSFFGTAYSWLENRANGLLKSNVPSPGEVYQALDDWIRGKRGVDTKSVTQFKNLTQALGEYMPFKSAMEMAERQSGSKTPLEVAAITSKLSWFEATSRLRWLESMHAVANIGGILANTSSIMRSLQPMAGETIEQAARRNSSLVMLNRLDDGTVIPSLNTPKLLWQSMKDAWKKVPDEFTLKAVRLGYMDQEVAEFNRAWGAIDSKEGWKAFVFGDTAREGTTRTDKFIRSGGLDKWLGLMSDKSEGFTRAWGMYAGRRAAESMGIHNVDDQIAFAHDITNKMIANYDPRNRAEIFQGAIGAPFGLFQSYVANFYQRMFRYAETQNYRAIASQYAAQGGVFGIHSLPGWDAVNWAFMDHDQMDGDPIDSIYKRFGEYDGDLLMHGAISNIPKLFGADGINVYTRGDANVQVPFVNVPMVDTLSRVWKGVGMAVKTLMDQHSLSMEQATEIMSNMVTNRPLAGMLEIAGGAMSGTGMAYDTSPDGQVVSSEVLGSAASMYRLMGIKSMQQQKDLESFYNNRGAQEEQAARKAVLNSESRAAIRAGDYDSLPGIFKRYVQEGGDPAHYTQWIKSNFDAATKTRSQRQLEKALKNPNNGDLRVIERLLDARINADTAESDQEDYGAQDAMDKALAAGWEDVPEPQESAPLPTVEQAGSQFSI